ncbi:MAG: class I SAM-dependent methyltransferase [Anaerolineales bacterium]|jgi:SAM-dependent methyltransferase
MLKEHEDAYGRELLAHFHGEDSFEIVERDDGYFDVSPGPEAYFAPYEAWPQHQQRAIRLAKGRVLDVGCGAGRVCLHLQEQGLNVLGIDISPLALEVCRLRGVKNLKLLSIADVGPQLGSFDTIVLFGNNFGLLAGFDEGQRILKNLDAITSQDAIVLAESNERSQTREPAHLAYQQWNQERGRMPGQLRLRVHFKKFVTPWFDYLIVTKGEMQQMVSGTGWKIRGFLDEPNNPMYVAILEKDERR